MFATIDTTPAIIIQQALWTHSCVLWIYFKNTQTNFLTRLSDNKQTTKTTFEHVCRATAYNCTSMSKLKNFSSEESLVRTFSLVPARAGDQWRHGTSVLTPHCAGPAACSYPNTSQLIPTRAWSSLQHSQNFVERSSVPSLLLVIAEPSPGHRAFISIHYPAGLLLELFWHVALTRTSY